MGAILEQLEINQTFFIEFALFAVLFFVLPMGFFRPFQRLIESRHEKTVADKIKAEKLIFQAEEKLNQYKTRLSAERATIRANFEKFLSEVKAEEFSILSRARGEAKKINQTTMDELQSQVSALKRSLEADVEGLALQISELLMKRQG